MNQREALDERVPFFDRKDVENGLLPSFKQGSRWCRSRLKEKIAERFCRIVPAPIFEVDENQRPAFRPDGVVQSEVRWRNEEGMGGDGRLEIAMAN